MQRKLRVSSGAKMRWLVRHGAISLSITFGSFLHFLIDVGATADLRLALEESGESVTQISKFLSAFCGINSVAEQHDLVLELLECVLTLRVSYDGVAIEVANLAYWRCCPRRAENYVTGACDSHGLGFLFGLELC